MPIPTKEWDINEVLKWIKSCLGTPDNPKAEFFTVVMSKRQTRQEHTARFTCWGYASEVKSVKFKLPPAVEKWLAKIGSGERKDYLIMALVRLGKLDKAYEEKFVRLKSYREDLLNEGIKVLRQFFA